MTTWTWADRGAAVGMDFVRPSLVLDSNMGGVRVSICACGALVWMASARDHVETCVAAHDWITKRETEVT